MRVAAASNHAPKIRTYAVLRLHYTEGKQRDDTGCPCFCDAPKNSPSTCAVLCGTRPSQAVAPIISFIVQTAVTTTAVETFRLMPEYHQTLTTGSAFTDSFDLRCRHFDLSAQIQSC
jgi:hypothetical protein